MTGSVETIGKKKCTSWRNSIRISPTPKYRALLKAMTADDDRKRVGDTVKDIIKKHFDSLPPDQKAKLIERSKHHY